MRILLVNDYFSPYMVGGAEVMVRVLAEGLAARDHQVMVVTARIQGTRTRERIDNIDVARIGSFPGWHQAVRLSSSTSAGPLSSQTINDFQIVLHAFRPDVVHFHNVWLLGPDIVGQGGYRKGVTLHDYWPVCVRRSMVRVNWGPCEGPGPVACRLCRLRAPSGLRSLNLITLESERAAHARRLMDCNFTTAPSQYLARRIEQTTGLRPSVLYNGIVPNRGPVTGQSEPRYALFAGRPTREKGFGTVLKTFRLPEMRGYQLWIAGLGSSAGSPNVLVLGRQSSDRMQELIAAASCVVVPSIWPENCPMIVLEALRAGVPIVASRIGGIPELIADGHTGILVEPGNTADLAGAIRRCFEDTRLRHRAGQEGPLAVRQRFSREGMLDRFEALYAA